MMAQPTIASLFSKAAAPAPASASAPPPPPRPPLPPKKPPPPRKPGKNLPSSRLQTVSSAQLEKKIEALRAKNPEARIVVLSLCWRLRCGSADVYRVQNESNHTAYDTFKKQTVLSYYEFTGLSAEGGVGAMIAEELSGDERTYVLVVDATPKAEFARLAACFGAVLLKLITGRAVRVAPPTNPLFAAAVAAASVCTTVPMLHYTMEAHFDSKMSYEVEPVEENGEVPRKKAKK